MTNGDRPSASRWGFGRTGVSEAVALAVVFFALHLPYLPASLEDLDSINFALGMRRYDIAHHQPHPPGYPVFIAAAKLARLALPSEAAALGALSVVSGALGVLAIAWMFRRLDEDATRDMGPLVAATLVITSPLYWFLSARPLSDVMGLAAATGVQAMTLAARTDRELAAAGFCAGVAAGIRSQVLWLTVPLLLFRAVTVEGVVGEATRAKLERSAAAAVACATGALVWFVPMVLLTGGVSAYWRALAEQGTEDLTGIRMLWTSPTPRALADALYYGFVAPWAVWPVAVVMLVAAAIGFVVLVRRRPHAVVLLAVAFGPYVAFNLLFQETFTIRYALPLVVPVGWLATAALRARPVSLALVAGAIVVGFNAHVGGRSIAALSREPAPVFRALADMRTVRLRSGQASQEATASPVLAPDRRQSFDLRRPLVWLGDAAPEFARQLPSPPQHEWLEAVKYWDGSGRAPVWFAVDPRRAAIDLVQHGDPVRYRWSAPYPVLLSGTRPNDLDWYRIDRPEWYVGEGWSLTPEAAGVAEADRRGLAFGPIEGRIRRDAAGGALVLGGRNFDPTARPQLTARIDGRSVVDVVVPPGPFLVVARLPAEAPNAAPDYVPIVVTASPSARVGVEQFDTSARRGIVGFGPGWQERELNPATGQQWRWLSDRAELQYVLPSGGVLHIEGESPRKYYSGASRLVVRQGDKVLSDNTLSDDFSLDIEVPVASQPSTLIVETDQTHVPAEGRFRRSADRRRLGLRIYRCELRVR